MENTSENVLVGKSSFRIHNLVLNAKKENTLLTKDPELGNVFTIYFAAVNGVIKYFIPTGKLNKYQSDRLHYLIREKQQHDLLSN